MLASVYALTFLLRGAGIAAPEASALADAACSRRTLFAGNMSSFLYRYNFRFWSFLLRSHWCAGALAAAPLWALGGVTAPSGRRPCVLEGAEKAPFGMRRDGVLNTLYTNIPFDAESST